MSFFSKKISRETYIYNSIQRIVPILDQKNERDSHQNKKESTRDRVVLSEEAKKFIIKKQEV